MTGLSRPRDRLQYRQSQLGANTHSRGRHLAERSAFPELRGLRIRRCWARTISAGEVSGYRPLPSVQGPFLTGVASISRTSRSDGRTDLRFEYAILRAQLRGSRRLALLDLTMPIRWAIPWAPTRARSTWQLGRWLRNDLKL